MSRCKACNKILKDWELIGTQDDGSPEELCNKCISSIHSSLDEEEEDEHNLHDCFKSRGS